MFFKSNQLRFFFNISEGEIVGEEETVPWSDDEVEEEET